MHSSAPISMATLQQRPSEGEMPRFYILREPDHIMVPLIPVDQLPFKPQGVPTKLCHRQMAEGGGGGNSLLKHRCPLQCSLFSAP